MIAKHPAKVKFLSMGRRWGKTVLGGSVGLACAARGAKVGWVVPTYRNGRPLWRWAEQTAAPLRRHRMVKINRADRLIEFSSGGFLGVYSADSPDSIRGDAFHILIVDEAARIPEEMWQAVLQPTLADFNGRAMLISTPRGRDWFWREWTIGKQDGRYQASWTAPSYSNPNPNIQQAYRLAKTKVSDRTFRQEWDAEFIEWEGAVFRLVEARSVVRPVERAEPYHQYVAGLDWGKYGDFTVLNVIDVTTGRNVWKDRFNTIDYEVQLTRIVGAHKRFRFRKILVETNAMGDPLLERCQRLELPVEGVTTTNASKALWVDDLSLALETDALELLDDPIQKDELVAFEGTKLPSGLIRYAAPEGMHDDCVMSLMLAWQAAKSPEPSMARSSVEQDVETYNSQRQTRTNLRGDARMPSMLGRRAARV